MKLCGESFNISAQSSGVLPLFRGHFICVFPSMLLQYPGLGAPALAVLLCLSCPVAAAAEIRTVRRGDNLQSALNAAAPGDILLLEAGAEFVGNFVLPVKPGDAPVVVRSAFHDLLPLPGHRIQPAHAPLLARLRSPNTVPAIRTAAGAHHWQLRYLELAANENGYGDIIQIGDGSSAQDTIARVPHDVVLSHLYVHGDPLQGQKRCVALNAAAVSIADSYISDCKGVGNDTQAIGGWNGPGPYFIENNYLEGAGENVMFGGADPAIPNLVADGITFRRNLVSRPMSWRDPIIPAPGNVSAAPQGGGALDPGIYAYRIVARRAVGQGTTGRSTASVEAIVAVGEPGSAVQVTWAAVPGATEYRVYGRAPGGEGIYWTVNTTVFTDTGAGGTAGAVPTSAGTMWSVKNLFELKNARNVVIEENIFENHWKESQPGYAIVFTPRNSNGGCAWCVVEHVRFERNLVRNVSAGINLLGYDSGNPSRQTVDVTIRQNLFMGLTTALGGNGWFLLIGDEPREVVLEHNTIDADGTTVISVYGGTAADPREILGFRMVANAARHGTYGINGSFFSFGTGIINGFFPGAVFTANYLAGGSASRYPAGTLLTADFNAQYANIAVADYTVREGSLLKRAAPDGLDIGVDYAALESRVATVGAGINPSPPSFTAPSAPSNLSVRIGSR
jgi:hypothetical protein